MLRQPAQRLLLAAAAAGRSSAAAQQHAAAALGSCIGGSSGAVGGGGSSGSSGWSGSSGTWSAQQARWIGGDRVPEYWGRPSPYTEGTAFLGTPANHDELIQKRPLSPDVFELNKPLQPHYKMPWGAVSSIANRATGAALSVGFAAAGYVALTGDLPGALSAFRADHPVLAVPVKLIVAFPLVYHYLGGLRHFVWDLHKIGNQADRSSLLETPKVEQSSQILLGASAALSLLLALL